MGDIVLALVKAMWALCTLQRGPQDLPASSTLMVLAVIFNAIGSALLESVQMTTASAVLAAVIDTLVMLALIRLLLQVKGLQSRFRQTVTAIAGAGLLLTFFALPVLMWISAWAGQQRDLSVPMLFWLAVFGWNLVVMAHILRHAIDSNLAIGFVLAIAFVFIDIQLINYLLPASSPAT